MMCSTKRMVFSVLLVTCVLASALAWPLKVSDVKSTAPAKATTPEVETPSAPETEKVSEKAQNLQGKVSELQGVLSSNSSNAKKLEEVEGLLNNAEDGLAKMTEAYEKAMNEYEKEVNNVHLAGLVTAGFTTGKPVAQAWDAGIELIGKYKKAIAEIGVSKQMDFQDFGGALKSGSGYRISVGGGYQFF